MATLLAHSWTAHRSSVTSLLASLFLERAPPLAASQPESSEEASPRVADGRAAAAAKAGRGRATLPKPGELVRLDFRPPHAQRERTSEKRPIRLLQWNIERGYQLEGIINELRRVQADVIALQEVDVHCERSGWKDTGREIAEALQLNYVLVCEFEELHSPRRSRDSQGGGVHGNAILSRYDFLDCRAIEHRCHPVDWEDPSHPRARSEPRRGRRQTLSPFVKGLSLAALVDTPQGPLLTYSAHLEVFCGMLARMAQFTDILRDSRDQIRKGIFRQAVLGDLNTLCHGIARLSPQHCNDCMRLSTLGLPEAFIWQEKLLDVPDPLYDPQGDPDRASTPCARESGELPRSATQLTVAALEAAREARSSSSSSCGGGSQEGLAEEGPFNSELHALGVPADLCRHALNPGFGDPWDPLTTETLNNPRYRLLGWPLMWGKLDWLLLRRLHVKGKALGNLDYKHSDHRWLCADVDFA